MFAVNRIQSPILPIVAALIILALCGTAFAATDDFYPAKVKDISDRAYEPAVIALLHNAQQSIVMAMYILRPDEAEPVRLLVGDLEDALVRDVSVEIYLNTKLDTTAPAGDVITPVLKSLIEKGATIHKVTPTLRLHDKLIVVDERYVVDGSVNWSVSALRSNSESAVLIDSPELATAKLVRLRRLPLEGDRGKDKPKPERPKGLAPLPEGMIVSVSKELMTNKKYLPAMVTREADHTMNVYLMLLAESARSGKKGFFITPEDMAVSAGVEPSLGNTALRHKVIRIMRSLQDEYGLLKADFSRGKDVWVELLEIPGGTFGVQGEFFDPRRLAPEAQSVKFVLLIKALLKAEGSSLDAVPVKDLAERFGISEVTIRKAERVLK